MIAYVCCENMLMIESPDAPPVCPTCGRHMNAQPRFQATTGLRIDMTPLNKNGSTSLDVADYAYVVREGTTVLVNGILRAHELQKGWRFLLQRMLNQTPEQP